MGRRVEGDKQKQSTYENVTMNPTTLYADKTQRTTYLLFLKLLEINPRILQMLGKCSTTQLSPRFLFLIFYFEIVSH